MSPFVSSTSEKTTEYFPPTPRETGGENRKGDSDTAGDIFSYIEFCESAVINYLTERERDNASDILVRTGH